MTMRQLEYFVAVAEQLSFTGAAKAFYISQTAVSQQIRALEEELGTRLFNRTKRRVELTPEGRMFLLDARAMLRRYQDSLQNLRLNHSRVHGKVTIGYVKGFVQDRMTRLLRHIHTQFPEVQILLVRENVGALFDRLAKGDCDIIFNLYYQVNAMTDLDELEILPIGQYDLKAVVPVSHPLAHREEIQASELKGYPLVDIVPARKKYGEADFFSGFFAMAGFVPEIAMLTDDFETSLLAVSAGIGYALMPSYITSRFPGRDHFNVLSIRECKRYLTVAAIAHRSNDNHAVQRIMCEIKEHGSM